MKTAVAICVTAILTAAATLAMSARAGDGKPSSAGRDNNVFSAPPREAGIHPAKASGDLDTGLLPTDGGEGQPDGKRPAPAAAADDAPEPTREEMFQQIATILKQKGTTKDDVLTITIPRDDLFVTVEGQDVPVAAGIESQFRFYQCPCGGKISVVGSFVTADYEANDVVDALREGHLVVASVGPFLTYEQPRLTMVRFQGEAKADEMGKILKKALEWTGEQRGKPQRVPDERD